MCYAYMVGFPVNIKDTVKFSIKYSFYPIAFFSKIFYPEQSKKSYSLECHMPVKLKIEERRYN